MGESKLSRMYKFKVCSLSVILAPLGLYWFFKYFRSPDPDKRKLACFVLIITLVTTAVVTYICYAYITVLMKYSDLYSEDLNLYDL